MANTKAWPNPVYVNAGDLGSCIGACANRTGCTDVSLSGAACYLKGTTNKPNAQNGIWGARWLGAFNASAAC